MDHREEIQDLAHVVGRGLTAYIEVHNRIFEEAASFKSVVKNIFGRGTPMPDLLDASERLVPLWDDILERMEAFRKERHSLLTPDERYYFDLLSRHADAVARTVDALVDRQRLLSEGSKTMKGNPLTWPAYQEKERAYKKAVEDYKELGADLNDVAHIVFD